MRYFLLALIVLACSDSPTEPGGKAHPGNLTLVQLNNSSLPTTVYVVDRVTSGTMVLRDDLTYTETFNAIGQAGTPITLVENGTYSSSDSRITFLISYGVTYIGDFSANGDLVTTGGRFPAVYHPS